MKQGLFLWVLIFIHFLATAQEAQEIQSYAKQQQSMDWYNKQAQAWKIKVDENKKDAHAWFNYYKASRIAVFRDEESKQSNAEREKIMNELVDAMGTHIPNSYEYNFCKWQLGGNDMKYYPYLQKAIEIDPNRKENIDYMINIGEMTRNSKQRDEYSLKGFNAGQLSSGMIYYNYNQLVGLEPNAILLTAGDNDTYPSWYLQAKGLRRDVIVINLYLLQLKDYRERICKELGIDNMQFDETSKEELEHFQRNVVKQLAKNKNNYPVYLAVTSCGHDIYMKDIEDKLYLTGLAYAYDTASVDNMALLKKNVETKFALDYLDKAFYNEIAAEMVHSMNINYLIPMLKLYEHYKLSAEWNKMKWLKEKIVLIAKDTEHEKNVLELIKD
jgi:hypothetical protein